MPKCRRKTLYKELRQYLGEVFRRLAEQKRGRVEEGHVMVDHVHGKKHARKQQAYKEKQKNPASAGLFSFSHPTMALPRGLEPLF